MKSPACLSTGLLEAQTSSPLCCCFLHLLRLFEIVLAALYVLLLVSLRQIILTTAILRTSMCNKIFLLHFYIRWIGFCLLRNLRVFHLVI